MRMIIKSKNQRALDRLTDTVVAILYSEVEGDLKAARNGLRVAIDYAPADVDTTDAEDAYQDIVDAVVGPGAGMPDVDVQTVHRWAAEDRIAGSRKRLGLPRA